MQIYFFPASGLKTYSIHSFLSDDLCSNRIGIYSGQKPLFLAQPQLLEPLFLPCIIIIIELTHSKTILENTVEIEPQPVALDFKNLSQYSSRSK